MTETVLFVLYPGVAGFDVAGPAQAFAALPPDRYNCVFASRSGGSVPTDCPGLTFDSERLSDVKAHPNLLILPGGSGIAEAVLDQSLIDHVRALGKTARRIASVCVGAFLAAEAGFLDRRRAATHWRAFDDFSARYPNVNLDREAIWVRDGNVWTSAGISAGVDLALALIEDDHGPTAALGVARELVVFLRRPGGQSQFSAALTAQAHDQSGRFSDLIAWTAENLAADLGAEQLANRVGMTPRTFARQFPAATGATPSRFIEAMRVEAARNAIATTDLLLEQVAVRCGFGDEQRLRRAFKRHFGVLPAEMRERFASATPGDSA